MHQQVHLQRHMHMQAVCCITITWVQRVKWQRAPYLRYTAGFVASFRCHGRETAEENECAYCSRGGCTCGVPENCGCLAGCMCMNMHSGGIMYCCQGLGADCYH